MSEPKLQDVNAYWLERGKTYASEERLRSEFYRFQEAFILDHLAGANVSPRSILELGCGFGRITKLLAGAYPDSRITAVDISPDQLRHAAEACAGLSNVEFGIYDFYAGAPLPGYGCDLAIAIEVWMHHPPEIVLGLIQKLAGHCSGHIVNYDWSEQWQEDVASHVWVHDYEALYRQAGLSCVAYPLPRKRERMQQKLFIASI